MLNSVSTKHKNSPNSMIIDATKKQANNALHPTAGVPDTFNGSFILFVLSALHQRRHRLWVSLGR